MSVHDATYHRMLRYVVNEGATREDRTGTGTLSLFGYQTRFDLQRGFPLLTTKKVNFKALVVELLWFLKGDTNIKFLVDNDCNLWNDWPLKNYNHHNHDFPLSRAEFAQAIRTNSDGFASQWGDCGPVYGKQWRKWDTREYYLSDGEPVDQIAQVITDLRANPYSRRHVVSAWNVADIPEMIPSGLPPCHTLFQFNARPLTLEERTDHGGTHVDTLDSFSLDEIHQLYDRAGVPKFYLDCQLYQRSADVFLGVPFNIASYALLIHMIAQQTNMVPGEFVHTFGNLHMYLNHGAQVNEQLSRDVSTHGAPQLNLTPRPSIDDYTLEDIVLDNYTSYPAIRAPVAV